MDLPERPSRVVVEVDSTAYPLRAVQQASHRFSDRLHVFVEPQSDSRIRIELTAKSGDSSDERFRFIRGEFQNELLEQSLRVKIADETLALRNLIVAQAFSATTLLDPVGESADFRADPLNIAEHDRPSVSRNASSSP